MQNKVLVHINFEELVHYGLQPSVEYRRDPLQPCAGYCVSCEEAGLLKEAGGELRLMSHGCDSSDYAKWLGPMPHDAMQAGPRIDMPIVFLMDSPGGQHQHGEAVTFGGYNKEPPVRYYYWLPRSRRWPADLEQFMDDFPGGYFAYLMLHHRLSDVYITNATKCGFAGSKERKRPPGDIIRHCTDHFLVRELSALRPRLVICFGKDVEYDFKALLRRKSDEIPYAFIRVMHPSYIEKRRRTQRELVEKNDSVIREALRDIR